MSDFIGPLLTTFETFIQGALALIAIGYFVSTQRLWSAKLLDFVAFARDAIKNIAPEGFQHWAIVYGAAAVGIVYFLGVLANLISFGIVRPAHEQLVENVYECVASEPAFEDSSRAQVGPEGAANAGVERRWLNHRRLAEPSVWKLADEIARDFLHASAREPSAEEAARSAERHGFYRNYTRDEAMWRTSNREAASSALDGLLKQSRIARTTVAATLAMGCMAIVKLVVLLLVTLYGWADKWFTRWARPSTGASSQGMQGDERLAGAILAWLDRRFVRNDEREQIKLNHAKASVYKLAPREAAVVRRETRRMFWTNVPVLLICALMYIFAVGAFKMVELEYHLMTAYGAQASEHMAATGQALGASAKPDR